MAKLKINKDYLKQLKTSPQLRVTFWLVVIIILFSVIRSGSYKRPLTLLEGVGTIILLALLAIIGLAPAFLVRIFNIKSKNQKPYFLELSVPIMTIFYLVGSVVGAFFGALLGNVLGSGNIVVIGIFAFLGFLQVGNIYIVYTFVFHKRVIAYGTSEWYEKRNSKLPHDK